MSQALKWWPAELVAESMPQGRGSPTAWLTGDKTDDGKYVVGGWGIDWCSDAERDTDPGEQAVAEGGLVEFICYAHHGFAEVTFRRDQTYERHGDLAIVGATVGANHFWLPYDTDTISDSMPMLAEHVAKYRLPPGNDEATFDVEYGCWSKPEKYRLTINAGRPEFVSVADEKRQ
jgi:hypothetical protein